MTNYIQEQFDKANAALEWLGIENPFTLEQITVHPNLERELKKKKAVMVITPKINDDFTILDLANKHEEALGKDIYVSDSFMGQTSTQDYQEPKVSFIYMDDQGAYDNEPGLYGTGKTADQQLSQLKKMKSVRAVNPVDYIMLWALNHDSGIDRLTYTRFIQDWEESARAFLRGGAWYNGSYAGVLALNLDSTPSHAGTSFGFRVARDIETLSLEPSDLPNTSSLASIAKDLEAIIEKERGASYKQGYQDGRKSVIEQIKSLASDE